MATDFTSARRSHLLGRVFIYGSLIALAVSI